MNIIHLTYPLQLPNSNLPGQPHVIAIGDFDGLHLGHRNVIQHAKQLGDQLQLPTSIMTFNPHPRQVLGQSQYTRYLAPFDEKMRLFAEAGVDYCFVIRFNENFSKVSPADFVDHMLRSLQVHTVVVGFDFTFGHRGSGTVDTLRELCGDQISVTVVKPFHLDGNTVSSTLIREQLHLGRLDYVEKYLGRHYAITGQVVTGHGRGRTIGFPTANLKVTMPYVIPRHGVYAVNVIVDHKTYLGVMNIGVKPTFSDDERNPTLEVHILDFSEQIYDKTIKIKFIAFLRDEQKFASVEMLVEQIERDIAHAYKVMI